MVLSKSANETSPSWMRCAEQEKRSLPVWSGGTVEKKGRYASIVKYYAAHIENQHFFHFQNNCKKRQAGKREGNFMEKYKI